MPLEFTPICKIMKYRNPAVWSSDHHFSVAVPEASKQGRNDIRNDIMNEGSEKEKKQRSNEDKNEARKDESH